MQDLVSSIKEYNLVPNLRTFVHIARLCSTKARVDQLLQDMEVRPSQAGTQGRFSTLLLTCLYHLILNYCTFINIRRALIFVGWTDPQN